MHPKMQLNMFLLLHQLHDPLLPFFGTASHPSFPPDIQRYSTAFDCISSIIYHNPVVHHCIPSLERPSLTSYHKTPTAQSAPRQDKTAPLTVDSPTSAKTEYRRQKTPLLLRFAPCTLHPLSHNRGTAHSPAAPGARSWQN